MLYIMQLYHSYNSYFDRYASFGCVCYAKSPSYVLYNVEMISVNITLVIYSENVTSVSFMNPLKRPTTITKTMTTYHITHSTKSHLRYV